MVYTIDGIDVTSHQKKCKVTYSDLDSSEGTGRTESGHAYRDRIRTNVRQIELEWDRLSDLQIYNILNSLKKDFFTVSFFDPYSLDTKDYYFYSGDRPVPLDYNISGKRLWSLSVTLVQQ